MTQVFINMNIIKVVILQLFLIYVCNHVVSKDISLIQSGGEINCCWILLANSFSLSWDGHKCTR